MPDSVSENKLAESGTEIKSSVATVEDLIIQAGNSSACAASVLADNETKSQLDLPPKWINPSGIKAGQAFVRRHFFLVFFTHFLSLILLLSYFPVRRVLYKTKRSHTAELALKRYVSTISHVKLWYEGDLCSLDGRGDATQDVIKIRKVHSGVYERLQLAPSSISPEVQNTVNEDIGSSSCALFSNPEQLLESVRKCATDENNNNNNNDWRIHDHDSSPSPPLISQLDMLVTQYCFMGLLTTYPQTFGITSRADLEGLEGFKHIWAVVGHHLGIEDRFNLCLSLDGNDKHIKTDLNRYVLFKILLNGLSRVDLDTFILWKALVTAMSGFVPCLSLHASLRFFLQEIITCVQTDEKSHFNDIGTIYDSFCYCLLNFLLKTCFHVALIRMTFNSLLRFAIRATVLQMRIARKK